jgi:DNA-binding response OmpR family regulator
LKQLPEKLGKSLQGEPNMAKQHKILIIEDEKPLAHALELKLGHEGFDVKAVFDGAAGLELLEKETFSLILLDLMMPRVDGFAVLRKLKEKNIGIPVIVLSNLSQEEDLELARSLGAKEFCIKSDTPIVAIAERVKKILNA